MPIVYDHAKNPPHASSSTDQTTSEFLLFCRSKTGGLQDCHCILFFIPKALEHAAVKVAAASSNIISKWLTWSSFVPDRREKLWKRHGSCFPKSCLSCYFFSHLQMLVVYLLPNTDPDLHKCSFSFPTEWLVLYFYLKSGKAAGDTSIQRWWACVTTQI